MQGQARLPQGSARARLQGRPPRVSGEGRHPGDARRGGAQAPARRRSDVKFSVIIPARYASTRFPGKPLVDLGGKPMVVRVCERAAQSGAAAVHVATDDLRIADAVRAHGHSALMTRADHASGTDRIAEAARQLHFGDDDIVVNLQGDAPLERIEAPEQLRVLWHGYRIAVVVSPREIPPGVDTPRDLEAVRKMLA